MSVDPILIRELESLPKKRQTQVLAYVRSLKRAQAREETTQPSGDLFKQMQAAVEAGDEIAFIQAANAMDWHHRSPEDYIHAVRLALSAGAHLKARKISAQGAEQYPEHAELQKYARILAPPVVTRSNEPPDPTLKANVDWLKANQSEYQGRWVALKAGELLGVGYSIEEIVAQVGDLRGKRILVTRVY